MTIRFVKSDTTVTLAVSHRTRVDHPDYTSVFAETVAIRYLGEEAWRVSISGSRVKRDGTAALTQGTCEFSMSSGSAPPPVWAVKLAALYTPHDVRAELDDVDAALSAAVLP